ncbi:hypothetical protein DL95DRAFT_182623 [Leptodontidium sp. 2 PMI_412]|nr:hypothetical protein DL95DRAFT_182623 [Leptodontidium sp. 2 PMI_412]
MSVAARVWSGAGWAWRCCSCRCRTDLPVAVESRKKADIAHHDTAFSVSRSQLGPRFCVEILERRKPVLLL